MTGLVWPCKYNTHMEMLPMFRKNVNKAKLPSSNGSHLERHTYKRTHVRNHPYSSIFRAHFTFLQLHFFRDFHCIQAGGKNSRRKATQEANGKQNLSSFTSWNSKNFLSVCDVVGTAICKYIVGALPFGNFQQQFRKL